MSRKRIDFPTLDKLLREGKNGVEIAKFFGVSGAAVSRARKQLKSTVIRTVALERASDVVDGHLDILGQARKINRVINKQLDAAVQDVEAARDEGRDPRAFQDIIVRLAAEVRRQCETYLQIAEAWRDFKEYEEFKNEIMDLLAVVPEEARLAFEQKIKERGLLRGTLSFNPD